MISVKFLGASTVAVAFLADLITKAVANAYSDTLTGGVPIFSGFNLTFLRNDGVSFGMLRDVPWWVLTLLGLGIIVWLVVMLVRAQTRFEIVGYGAVIGGALGNVVDRLRFGAVTDFLDVYVGAWHWPTFNLADVAIVGGVGLLLLSEFPMSRKSRRQD